MSRGLRACVAVLAFIVATGVVSPASAQRLRDAFGPGELSAAHREDGKPLPCERCHEAGAFVEAPKCLDCHDEIAALRARPGTFHARQTDSCASCHPEHRGLDHQLVRFDPDAFDHAQSGFALDGAHRVVRCRGCHEGEGWLGAPTACADCHDTPHGSGFVRPARMTDCAGCHSTKAWDDAEAEIDHAATRFPLDGAHREVACADCHEDAVYAPVASGCADCHDAPHRGDPGDCVDCHETSGWDDVGRIPHQRFGFALRGLHASAPCASCHGSDALKPVAHAGCVDCHDDPHEGQFGARGCDDCHDEGGWALTAAFEHPFERVGAHAALECGACHEGGYFAGLPSERCDDCHDDVHAARFAPDDCAACHGQDAFAPATVDLRPDHGRTGYPLDGEHAEVACADCHAESTVPGPEHASCEGCHEDPHGLEPGACLDCHDVARPWRSVSFDHQATGFALTSSHEGVACRACHDSRDFVGAETSCRSCHTEDAPRRHFPQECDRCHTVEGWAGATLDASAHTVLGFPLRDAHLRSDCADCHPGGADAEPECFACHGSEDPHRNMLGDACDACHRENTWFRSTFRHSQVGWPLRGEHALAECDDCHAAGFLGTPQDCEACHAGGASWP